MKTAENEIITAVIIAVIRFGITVSHPLAYVRS
jgi:hypothetical protein